MPYNNQAQAPQKPFLDLWSLLTLKQKAYAVKNKNKINNKFKIKYTFEKLGKYRNLSEYFREKAWEGKNIQQRNRIIFWDQDHRIMCKIPLPTSISTCECDITEIEFCEIESVNIDGMLPSTLMYHYDKRQTHEMATWQPKQKLDWWVYKPRDARKCPYLPKNKKQVTDRSLPSSLQRAHCLADVGLSELAFLLFVSCQVCPHLLHQL